MDKAINKRLNALGVGKDSVSSKGENSLIKYRLLNNGEIIISGDELYIKEHNGWMTVDNAGCKYIGEEYNQTSLRIRRRIDLDIKRAEKAIKLLDELCNSFHEVSDSNHNITNKAFDVIQKWLYSGKKKEKVKYKKCRITDGPFAGRTGMINYYFAFKEGIRCVNITEVESGDVFMDLDLPESMIELL